MSRKTFPSGMDQSGMDQAEICLNRYLQLIIRSRHGLSLREAGFRGAQYRVREWAELFSNKAASSGKTSRNECPSWPMSGVLSIVCLCWPGTVRIITLMNASAAQNSMGSSCQRDVTHLDPADVEETNLATTRSHRRPGNFNGSNFRSSIHDSLVETSRSHFPRIPCRG